MYESVIFPTTAGARIPVFGSTTILVRFMLVEAKRTCGIARSEALKENRKIDNDPIFNAEAQETKRSCLEMCCMTETCLMVNYA